MFHSKTKESSINVILNFINKIDIHEAKKIFLKNINNFKVINNDSNKNPPIYNNLSPEMLYFFSKFLYVSYNDDYIFSHDLLKEADFITDNLFYVGKYSGGNLYSKKELNYIFYDDSTEEMYDKNQGEISIYHILIEDFLIDKYEDEKDLFKLKEKLHTELE